jgi:hypothetical protein
MAKRVQIIGNTTAGTGTFVGLAREVTVDTDRDELIVHTGGGAGTHERIPNKTLNDTYYQALSSLLTALAALSTADGLPAKTGAATLALRTITGTANQITVTNGGGAAGNPTLSLPSAITAPGSVAITTTLTATGGLSTLSTSQITALTATQLADLQGKTYVTQVEEKVTSAATGTISTTAFDSLTQPILNHTSNATGNFYLNFRGDGSTTYNDASQTDKMRTFVFITTQGGTAYYLTGLSIDGTGQTINWLNDTAPSAGTTSGKDIYTISILKTAANTYTVFAQRASYG